MVTTTVHALLLSTSAVTLNPKNTNKPDYTTLYITLSVICGVLFCVFAVCWFARCTLRRDMRENEAYAEAQETGIALDTTR